MIGRGNDVSASSGIAGLFTYRGSKRSMSSPRPITDQAIEPSLSPTASSGAISPLRLSSSSNIISCDDLVATFGRSMRSVLAN